MCIYVCVCGKLRWRFRARESWQWLWGYVIYCIQSSIAGRVRVLGIVVFEPDRWLPEPFVHSSGFEGENNEIGSVFCFRVNKLTFPTMVHIKDLNLWKVSCLAHGRAWNRFEFYYLSVLAIIESIYS